MFKHILAGCAAVALFAGAANAATVFSENFDGENGGNQALSYNNFKNFTVSGDVDLIAASNSFGISCFGNSGLCVDLNGNANGRLTANQVIRYGVGDTVTLSAMIAGSGRNTVNNVNLSLVDDLTFASTTINGIGPSAGYTRYSTSFVGTKTGFVFARISSLDDGVVGAVIDNITVDVTPAGAAAVPETATWAMMIAGFGVTGATLRRRRASVLARA